MTNLIPNKEGLFKKLKYEPHSKEQWDFHHSDARYKIPCCGRRWGKSTAAAREMTFNLFTPDSIWWIVAPDYGLGEKEFRIVHHDINRKLGLAKKVKSSYNVKQGDMQIYIPDWNAQLIVKSEQRPDSLVGEGLNGVLMSESARLKKSTWEQLIRPALADKHGTATFPSTPRGFNWYEGLYRLGATPELTDYQSWRFPSWTNNVIFPKGRHDPEIVSIEEQVSKTFFKQEIAALFTAFEGQIYEEFDRDIHIRDIPYNPAWANYVVFDFGFSNPFVALDIMVDPSDNVYVWREYQKSGLTSYEHGQYLRYRENPEGYHVDGMWGDPRGPGDIATLAMHLGPIGANEVDWDVGVEYVKRWMKISPHNKKPRLFFDRSCTDTIRQVEQLRRPEVKEGKAVPESKQHKYDDHGADALRYFFGEYFVLGGGSHLADVYSGAGAGSEAEGFFKQHAGITLGDPITL